ncbi:hypothetical protein [Paenibacillus sp. UASWS1643]|uniref:hypothetical protein n=1 Tax=Paenibacillus sp. UASWS1643 TaxID=2580422 RepID=UPI00123BC1B2|nr:hypothetical protein [Paenibacillus sp. UASWS1643]KAA8750053.1 hypothetical protein FE296_15760 [Paenibacillus sp. UASWS1643]
MGTPIPNRRIESISSGSSEVIKYKLTPEELAALPPTPPMTGKKDKPPISLANRNVDPSQRKRGRPPKVIAEPKINYEPRGKTVQVSPEQAKAIVFLLQPIEGGWNEDELVGEHANAPNDWRDEAEALNGMTLGDLINALYVGMDIKEG